MIQRLGPLLCFTALSLVSAACGTVTGSQCGGGQYASASVILPDTGISAGSQVRFSFIQHSTAEFTEVVLQQIPVPGQPVELPRVRLLHDDGRVLIDQASTLHNLGQSWILIHIERASELRTAIFEGLEAEKVSLQLLRWPSAEPGTVIRIHPEEIGVTPVTWCV